MLLLLDLAKEVKSKLLDKNNDDWNRKKPWLLFLISLVIVAFAQPSKIFFLCPIASICGYGIIWHAMRGYSKKRALLFSFTWFFLVQMSWQSWLCSTKYQGIAMVFVYIFICSFFAVQFSLVSLILWQKQLSWKNVLLVPAVWTLMEMSRVFILTGYLWGPVGLSLSAFPISLQWASVGGVYLLSFWVMLCNALFCKAVEIKKHLTCLIFLCLVPYLFGFFHETIQKKKDYEKDFSALLIQTGLLPEEKYSLSDFPRQFIRPLDQWKMIFQSIQKEAKENIDLIVLPEAALPFSSFLTFYALEDLKDLWRVCFKEELYLPKLLCKPFAEYEYGRWVVSNAYINQALSMKFDCGVICGLDHHEEGVNYNSAFYFATDKTPNRYDKQVLVPLGEYIPFSFLSPIAAQFGILSFFSVGSSSKPFIEKFPIGISICLEEIYPELMRESRRNGASLFVNISNDGWFPNSTLPKQHFDHGILRAVENGVFLFRAGNTGITGVVDPFGRIVKTLKENKQEGEKTKGSLFIKVPFHNHETLYTFWGDNLIFGISFLICMLFLRRTFV